MTRRAVVAVMLLLIAGCQKKNETAAIDQVRNEYAAAWKAGDAAKLAGLYDENAVHAPNNQPAMTGRVAIASALGGQFAQMAPNEIVLNAEKTEINGDVAYDYGTFQISMTPRNGGSPMSESGRYLVLLRRQGDGTWKIIADMDNSAAPPAATAPAPAPAPPPTTTTTQ